MKYALALLVLGGFLYQVAAAEDYVILSELGTSAEMIGIGRVNGFSKSADIIFENPAGMRSIRAVQAGFFTTRVVEANYQSFSVAFPTTIGVVGIGYFGTGVDGIVASDVSESGRFISRSTFSISESVSKIGLQTDILGNVSFGGSVVFYSKNLVGDSVFGANFELGIQKESDIFSYSVVMRNVLPLDAVYKSGAREKMPMHIVPAVSYKLDQLTLYGQGKCILGKRAMILSSAGMKYDIIPGNFSVLGGVSEILTASQTKSGRFQIGTVLNFNSLSLQYAYEKGDYDDEQNQHYISMGVAF